MRRIGILQALQESNSFNPVLTTAADFARFGVGAGAEVVERFGNVGEIAGFMEGIGGWRERPEPAGILRLHAWPCGPLSGEAFRWILHSIETELDRAGELDGLLCSLHGALVSEVEDDVDGALLELLRARCGTSIPIVATLDLHAHLTARMVSNADALVAYHTSPHVDQKQTGIRAAALLSKILGGARPKTVFQRLPMISIAEAQNTFAPPLASLFTRLAALESEPGMLSAGILMTQGWLDVPRLGWSVFIVSDGDAGRAEHLATDLSEHLWRLRTGLHAEFLPGAESVETALAHKGRPVIIADGADATNSGAGGDSTHLLAELTRRPIPGRALVMMVDPAAVAEAKRVGLEAPFHFAVGGKRDRRFSKPLRVQGKVAKLSPARYVLTGHGGHNLPVDMGMSAVVRVRDVDLLLVEAPGPGSTPLMYQCVGLEPRDYQIVIVKSPAGFRAEFEPFASLVVLADCPGCASPHYERMPYTRIHHPLWPIDPVDDWRAVSWLREEGSS